HHRRGVRRVVGRVGRLRQVGDLQGGAQHRLLPLRGEEHRPLGGRRLVVHLQQQTVVGRRRGHLGFHRRGDIPVLPLRVVGDAGATTHSGQRGGVEVTTRGGPVRAGSRLVPGGAGLVERRIQLVYVDEPIGRAVVVGGPHAQLRAGDLRT